MIDIDKERLSSELKGSLIEFIKTFFPLITGRDYIVSNPVGRESHHVTICRALTRVQRLEIPNHRLLINVPPGHSKSVSVSMWIAWCLAHHPDSNFLYISYSKSLAAKHTEFIKRIITSRYYQYLFDVRVRDDSRAKDLFKTEQGGTVGAYGSASSITGQDAGLPGLDRFSGAVIVDDPHKPDEAHSDTIRESVIDNYRETIQQRARGIKVPFVFIGQRLHEYDLAAYLIEGKDGYDWHKVILKSVDSAGNALYPEAFPLDMLKIKEERDPYVFASQFQQDPIPSGGGLFKAEWFPILSEEPEILATFITADTAETNKSWNDATVFSFWGVYEVDNFGRKTGEIGLHWLDCVEMRIEPKDLKDAFMDFYIECNRHPKPPLVAAIEKKSTGVTLVSVLQSLRGIGIREIERTRASGSKTQRFLEMQPYVASKCISFTENARHMEMCINHMTRITANQSHRNDDVCFIAGTRVATVFGDKPIEKVVIGDYILTPFGLRKVLESGMTAKSACVINRAGLVGTPEHKILKHGALVELKRINGREGIHALSLTGLIKFYYKKNLYFKDANCELTRPFVLLSAQEQMPVIQFSRLFFGAVFKAFLLYSTYKLFNGLKWILNSIKRLLYPLRKKEEHQVAFHVPVYQDDKVIVVNIPMKATVYNITVEHVGMYYANGILVSNCDTVSDAVKLALIDKSIYSVDQKDSRYKGVLDKMSSSFTDKLHAGIIRNAGIGTKTR